MDTYNKILKLEKWYISQVKKNGKYSDKRFYEIKEFDYFQFIDRYNIFKEHVFKETGYIEYKGVRLWFDSANTYGLVFSHIDILQFDFSAWIREVQDILKKHLKNLE